MSPLGTSGAEEPLLINDSTLPVSRSSLSEPIHIPSLSDSDPAIGQTHQKYLNSADSPAAGGYLTITKGDMEAFIMVFTNNLATLLTVIAAVGDSLGPKIIYERLVPGVGYAMLFGNLYYYFMAWRLRTITGRTDVCAQPYGINTPGAFAFAFSVIGAAYNAEAAGSTVEERQEYAWKVGIASNFLSSITLFAGSIVGKWVSERISIVALLTSLSGIAISFLALNSFLDPMQYPIAGFAAMFIMFFSFYADVHPRIPYTHITMPAITVSVLVGSAIGWAFQITQWSDVVEASNYVQPYAPIFAIKDIFDAFPHLGDYLSIIIPISFTVAIGTIQCVSTAHFEGDYYSIRDSMIGDGFGTLIGSLFGSPLGMTVFIGHPTLKRMGARTGHSLLAGLIFFLFCVFGLVSVLGAFIVNASVQPSIMFVGLDIAKETLSLTPPRHYPAFMFGLFPSIANWAVGTIIGDLQSGFQQAYTAYLAPKNIPTLNFNDGVLPYIPQNMWWGLQNLNNGAILMSLCITSLFMHLIDRQFLPFAVWCFISAVISLFGLINYSTVGWISNSDIKTYQFFFAYSIGTGMGLLAHWAQKRGYVLPEREEAVKERMEKRKREQAEMAALQKPAADTPDGSSHLVGKAVAEDNWCCGFVDRAWDKYQSKRKPLDETMV